MSQHPNRAFCYDTAMIERLETKQLILPKDITPSHADLQVIGVFNPGAAMFNGEPILLVRVAETATEQRDGFLASPKLVGERASAPIYQTDWHVADSRKLDQRKFRLPDGRDRLTSISHFEIVRLSQDGMIISISKHADLFGHGATENFGIEDARITKIGETFYISYVGVSDTTGIATHLMTTKDFNSFRRHGIIFATENKDVVIFPQKIDGKFVAIHRPVGLTSPAFLTMWLAESPDLIHWGHHKVVTPDPIEPTESFRRLGAGPPPLQTDHGWLIFYHEVVPSSASPIGTYMTGAILTDLHHPWRPIAQTQNWLIGPDQPFEQAGFVPNVVFPTGLIRQSSRITLYYGAADTSVAMMTLSLEAVMANLRPCAPLRHHY